VLRTIMLPQGLKVPPGPLSLKLTRGKQALSFPVQATEERGPAGDVAYLPSRLAGILNLFKRRNISFDPTEKEFILARRGYAGFRMYAATIDDVPKLKQFLEGPGQALRVHTEASRIRDVVELNTYLTLIFWLIAVVGIVGGLASLIASLYASVERKKKEMAVLRLLGLSGGKLFRFPIYQGIIIAGGGYLVAMAFFQLLAYTINTLFAAHLQKGESFCELPWPYALASLAATIAIAVLAATLAAWRATRIEPAEALRDE
jgi:putative ABC transport system permease protein